MNIEFEVKQILKQDLFTSEQKADKICSFTNHKKENVLKSLKKGGKTSSDIYSTMIVLWEK